MKKLSFYVVKFIKKGWLQSFDKAIFLKSVDFFRICTTSPKQMTQFFQIRKFEGQWEVSSSEITHPPIYQKVKEWKLMFFMKKKTSKMSNFHYLQPDLHPSCTDVVEPINMLNQEKHNHS